MANNCLQTKLKATVNNDNLVTMDEIRVGVLGSATLNILPIDNKSITLNIIKGDGTFNSNHAKSINITSAGSYLASITATEPCVISVKNKFNLQVVSLNNEDSSNDGSYVKYCPYITRLNGFYLSLKDINDMVNKGNITNISMYAKSSFDIANITGYSSLENLSIYTTNVYGNINTLNTNCPSLKGLRIHGAMQGDASTILATPTSTSGVYPILQCTRSNYGASTLSWSTTRPQTTRFLELIYINLGDSLNDMLINQANLTYDGPDVSSSSVRGLNVYGNLGSSTEVTNAIAAIKAKGLGVIINGINR